MMRPVLAALLVAVAMTATPGCGSSQKTNVKATTTGQELQDLEDARDKGLITESDYQKQRKRILDGK